MKDKVGANGRSQLSSHHHQETFAIVAARARLGVAEHMVENGRVFTFHLDAEDWERLDAVQARSRDLFKLIGDCGDEDRR